MAGLCCEDVRRAPVANTSPSEAYIAGGLRWGNLSCGESQSLGCGLPCLPWGMVQT